MTIDIRPLLNPMYWLSLNPPTVWQGSARFVAVAFVGMLVASVFVRRYKAGVVLSTTRRRVASLLAWMGAIALVLFFFSYEQIQTLGGRLFYSVWMLGLIAWIVTIVTLARRERRAVTGTDPRFAEREKYLPRPKR